MLSDSCIFGDFLEISGRRFFDFRRLQLIYRPPGLYRSIFLDSSPPASQHESNPMAKTSFYNSFSISKIGGHHHYHHYHRVRLMFAEVLCTTTAVAMKNQVVRHMLLELTKNQHRFTMFGRVRTRRTTQNTIRIIFNLQCLDDLEHKRRLRTSQLRFIEQQGGFQFRLDASLDQMRFFVSFGGRRFLHQCLGGTSE